MSEKGFLKKVGGLLFEVTENEQKEQPKSIGSPSLNTIPTSIGSPIIQNTLDSQELDKFIKHFENLFDQANLPGPDYYEFDKMSNAMLNLPEETRVNAAYSGLSVQGLTKDKLVSTAHNYIGIIEEDQKNFEASANNVVSSDIQTKKNNVEALTKSITDAEELIEKLKNDIITNKTKLNDLQIEIQNDEHKISQKLSSYRIACENKKQQIQNNINQIQKYIK